MAATPSTPATGFHIAGLDGLRAVAVATVVAFHLFAPVASGGFLGVDIFFVISGFLITALLLREHAATGRVSLSAFWLRRARRLLPALGALLAVTTALALAVGGDALVRIGVQLIGAVTFSSNWVLLATGGSYFAETTPELLRNLWSLAVEEQFYLVWPLLFLALVRLPLAGRAALVGAGALASAIAMALFGDPAAPTAVYYGTGTHAFGLALGALLALVSREWPTESAAWPRAVRLALGAAGVVALTALVALAAFMPSTSAFVLRGGLQLIAVLSAVVIAALLVPGALTGRLLGIAPLVWLGRRSYAVYLWHWPLWVLAATAWPSWTTPGPLALSLGAGVLVVTLLASELSYRVLEQPIRRDGFRAVARRWLALGAVHAPGSERVPRPRLGTARRPVALAAAALLVVGVATSTALAVQRAPAVGEAEASLIAGLEALERFEQGPPPPADTEAAPDAASDERPAPSAGEQIVAIGDSVLLAAAPQLRAEFPGIRIDAAVSRQMWQAPGIVAELARAGKLRPIVVIALGTNGSIADADLRELRRLVGPERMLVLVNAQAPRGWIPEVNVQLSRFAQAYREVELANWHAAIQPRLDVLARDQVHFGEAGARIFTRALTDALQRLAELPPLRDDRDDLAYPQPG